MARDVVDKIRKKFKKQTFLKLNRHHRYWDTQTWQKLYFKKREEISEKRKNWKIEQQKNLPNCWQRWMFNKTHFSVTEREWARIHIIQSRNIVKCGQRSPSYWPCAIPDPLNQVSRSILFNKLALLLLWVHNILTDLSIYSSGNYYFFLLFYLRGYFFILQVLALDS